MTIDHLRNIAERVKEIGGKGSYSLSVTLDVGDDSTVTDALVALGGHRQRIRVDAPDEFRSWHVNEAADLDVDGVRFHAQWTRDAMQAEIAGELLRQAEAARRECHSDGRDLGESIR